MDEWMALPRRHLTHPWRWVSAALVCLLLGAVFHSLANNPAIDATTILRYLFAPPILQGVLITLQLTVMSLVMGVALGYLLAVMRRSRLKALARFAQGYTWIFRSVPQLIQIIWWYNLGVLYPRLVIEVPILGFSIVDVATNDVMQKFTAALIALTLCQSAYQAEIIRAALMAPAVAQREAAYAIGMTHAQAMRTIILPQALRAFIPPAGNELAHLIKGTSVVAFITLADLMYTVQTVYSQNYQVIPMLMVASLWYLALVGGASLLQSVLERRLRW
jgi:polar amino acid transport system permease protein